MTRRFERKIKVGFVGVTLILAFIVVLAITNSRQVREASKASAQSQEILRELESILSTMLDAETGMRGYLITGQESYLKPYENALVTIGRQMAGLKRLFENSGIDEQLTQLDKAVADQIAFRKSVVEKVKASGASDAVRSAIRIDEGKNGMDEIRSIVNQLEAAQEQALTERKKRSEEMDDRAMGTLILFVLITIGFVVGGMMLVRHHLAARLKLEEERNRFFTLSDDLYCIAGVDGYFKEVNPAAVRILGFSARELTSKPFLDFVHPDDQMATRNEAEKLAKGGRTVYFENRYRTSDGDYRWILWSAAPLTNEKLIYAVGKDITEHKKNEQRIVQMAEDDKKRAAELESLNKELEAFSYSVSHDLRAPLRHIAGFSDMLQRHADGTLDEKGRRYLNTIIESSKKMGMLIDDLLVFSRMGRSEMRHERIDLNSILDGVIEELSPDIGMRRVVWKKQKLPEVLGDRAMLKQVWANLISNALKYSGTREVAEIEVGYRDEPNETVFFVRDNGVGFDMAYAHKLFGVFQRLHEASQFEGTGIGLANVRRIVARHGGKTWAEAELDKGASFYFSLPKSKTNATA